jgi:hypothetical protein
MEVARRQCGEMFWSDTANVEVPIGVYLAHRPIILALIVIFILLYVIIIVGCLTGTGTLAVPIDGIVDFFSSFTPSIRSLWSSPCYRQVRGIHPLIAISSYL